MNGLTITRVDFNLSGGEDLKSTAFSISPDGVVTCHGAQSHATEELSALYLAAVEIRRAIQDAEHEHRASIK